MTRERDVLLESLMRTGMTHSLGLVAAPAIYPAHANSDSDSTTCVRRAVGGRGQAGPVASVQRLGAPALLAAAYPGA